jgi:hypothetical protein
MAVKARFRLKDGTTLSVDEMLKRLEQHPSRTVSAVRDGVRLETSPEVLAELQQTVLGEHIGDDGTISFQMGEEALVAVAVAMLLGFAGGVVVGLAIADAMDNDDGGTNGDANGGKSDDSEDGGDTVTDEGDGDTPDGGGAE